MIRSSLHFDQLELSLMVSACCKRSLIYEEWGDTCLGIRLSYLECSKRLRWLSKVLIGDFPLRFVASLAPGSYIFITRCDLPLVASAAKSN